MVTEVRLVEDSWCLSGELPPVEQQLASRANVEASRQLKSQ